MVSRKQQINNNMSNFFKCGSLMQSAIQIIYLYRHGTFDHIILMEHFIHDSPCARDTEQKPAIYRDIASRPRFKNDGMFLKSNVNSGVKQVDHSST